MSSADHWADRLGARDAPVLQATRDALAGCRERMDRVDANALAHVALQDPLMSLRVLAHCAQRFGDRLSRPVETVTAALVLLGIEPFFRAFESLDTVQERLAGDADALAALEQLVARAGSAAQLAAAIAVHRQDEDAEVLSEAALLTGFGQLLLWTEAPAEAHRIAALKAAHPEMRTADAERAVLGVEVGAIETRLMARWRLPSLLHEMAKPGLPAHPSPRTVALAVRMARHLERGWDHPLLAQDCEELAHLLNVGVPVAQTLVREVVAGPERP